MKVIYVNPGERQCGVTQYGHNLERCLFKSSRIQYHMDGTGDVHNIYDYIRPDAILYNWQAGQGGYLAGAPFPEFKCKQVLVYHDCDVDESKWDAILFSDPTMPKHGKWHPIGRPIPPKPERVGSGSDYPVIGVYGFRGAQADRVVAQVLKEYEVAVVRMLLPFSHYCDLTGAEAHAAASRCQQMVAGTGVVLDISHEFLPHDKLIEWLSDNSVNCFFRNPVENWRGVSSAPDAALAARRPIAVNHCNAFRHLHNTSPSICIETHSLTEIVRHGLTPLVPLYEKWSAESICNQVDDILLNLLAETPNPT